ncbi:MAG: AlpA family phage regulatory protein, partial [Chromatiaceae bacterium]|nr:AlpA family phage regulatory protein [Chromatiaceae bacterium]
GGLPVPEGSRERMRHHRQERLINAIETCRLTGLRRSELLRLCERGVFPRPRRHGSRTVWRESDVRAWRSSR